MQGHGIETVRMGWIGWLAVGAMCLAGAAGCQSTGTRATQDTTSTGSEWNEGSAGGSSSGSAMVKPEGSNDDLGRVYFALDRADLDDEAREALRGAAKQIQANPDWGRVTIEGHCDERGSEEYNLGLGARRAESVSRYLRDLGVPAERLHTVSFGEDRPAVAGHSETAWRFNRRSEFRTAPRQASR